MKRYKHLPTEVDAVHVVKPYAGMKAFPRSHANHFPSGKISNYHIVDAVGRTAAYPGDYVVKHDDGTIEILTEAEFNLRYEAVE